MRSFIWLISFFLYGMALYAQIPAVQLTAPEDLFGNVHGKTHAVIVGVSDYAYIKDLSFCHKDAEEFDRFLLSESSEQNRTGWVDLFTNEKATEGDIIHSLTHMCEIANPEDIVFFFFSGHGAPEGLTHHLTQDGDIMEYFGLKSILRNCKAKRKIMVLDACHAGASGDSNYMGVVGDMLNNQKNTGICLISASKASEYSLEYDDKGMGYFTYFFIEGLRGMGDVAGNQDNLVTLQEAFEYAETMVLMFTLGEQTPVISGDVPTDFIVRFLH